MMVLSQGSDDSRRNCLGSARQQFAGYSIDTLDGGFFLFLRYGGCVDSLFLEFRENHLAH